MFEIKVKVDGEELKRLRKASPYTQESLAEKLKISRETVNAIENNKETAITSISVTLLNKWRYECELYADSTAKERFVRHLRNVFGL
jgi:transcriptional regulator with XRE-family HTH domain